MEGVIVTQLACSFIHEGSRGGGELKLWDCTLLFVLVMNY